MKVAIDTNVLLYMDATSDDPRRQIARDVLTRIPTESVLIPAQVLGEYVRVQVRKQGLSPQEAKKNLQVWIDTYEGIATSVETIVAAADLATVHQLAFWDAVILVAAANAGCRLLLSEDMHNGFTWSGVTVVDPFASPRHQLLESLLAGASD